MWLDANQFFVEYCYDVCQGHLWEDMAAAPLLHRQHALRARRHAVTLLANAYRDELRRISQLAFLIP